MGAGLSCRFSHAVVRRPARSCVDGIRAEDIGDPDFEAFQRDHDAYIAALEAAGVEVICLEALEEYPDSVFVEDPAFCLPGIAVRLRPGAQSRRGEVDALNACFDRLAMRMLDLPDDGFVDGGDILVTDREVLIGLSDRTDRQGAEGFKALLAGEGYTVRVVETPADILHFKTGCATLGDDTVLVDASLDRAGAFDGYERLIVPENERYAANVIRINSTVLVPEGYPETAALISRTGLAVTLVPTSEARKLDGGLSCMSLRFTL